MTKDVSPFANEVSLTWSLTENRFIDDGLRKKVTMLRRLFGHSSQWKLKLPIDLVSGAFDNRREPGEADNDLLLIEFRDEFEAAVCRAYDAGMKRRTEAQRCDPPAPIHLEFEYHLRRNPERWFLLKAGLGSSSSRVLDVIHIRIQDITGAMRRGQAAEHRARTDALTGLLNKETYTWSLERLMRANADAGRYTVVMVIDLRQFKRLNDAKGHMAGDIGLAAFGAALRKIRAKDILRGRTGGDEFGIAATVESSEAAQRLADIVSRRLNLRFKAPTVNRDIEQLTLIGDLGVTLVSEPIEFEEAYRQADIAMFQAKQARLPYVFYNQGMDVAFSEDYHAEIQLRDAVRGGLIGIEYLPTVNAKGRYVGVEALAASSTKHLAGGIGLEAVMDLIREHGLLVDYTLAQIQQACREIAGIRRRWPESDFWVSVNIEPSVLKTLPEFPTRIGEILEETGLPAEALHLEVTESEEMLPSRRIRSTLKALHESGVKVVVDDFGKAHANLLRILTYREYIVGCKLDKYLVRTITREDGRPHRPNRRMVGQVVRELTRLGLDVCPEGISSLEQWEFFKGLGCAYAQGFFLGGFTGPDGGKYNIKQLHALLAATADIGFACETVSESIDPVVA